MRMTRAEIVRWRETVYGFDGSATTCIRLTSSSCPLKVAESLKSPDMLMSLALPWCFLLLLRHARQHPPSNLVLSWRWIAAIALVMQIVGLC